VSLFRTSKCSSTRDQPAIASARLENDPAAHHLQKVAIENGSQRATNLTLPLSVEVAKGASSAR
jgi:hypothetical protein